MLLKHSFYYLIARGIPGLVNFAALALYTRLLAPEEYGRYALLVAVVGFVNVVMFQWLRLVAVRFLQGQTSPNSFLGGIQAQFYLLAAAVCVIGWALAVIWPDPVWQRLIALAVPLLVSQAAIELTLAVASARLEPRRYGVLLGSKAVLAVGVGGLLAWMGLGAKAPVWGLIVGQCVALLLLGRQLWQGARPSFPERNEWRRQLSYGLPLIATFALAWVVSGSDRLLLAWLIDEDAVGYYSAGYDLAFQSLTLLLTIINTAAYPLAVRALEQHGEAQARAQLAKNGELIITAALAGATGLVVLAPSILELLIGEAFRPGAAAILPIVAVASAVAGIKAYYFDLAFHLGQQSRTLVWFTAFAAVANIVLNLLLIPWLGIAGAAWATLSAYVMACLLSAYVGCRTFSMPGSLPFFLKGALAALGATFGAGIVAMLELHAGWALLAGLLGAAVGVLAMMLVLNIAGLRHGLQQQIGF
ncbi:MAG: lipopolysaccharide biosynthesis protein [Halomonadaceae bacterium]